MEAIGTLAGGIAHDFNNILTPMIVHTEMMLLDAKEGDPNRHHLDQVLKACDRAKDLVKQTLTFSRKGEQKDILLMAGPVIKEAIKLLRASLPSTIEIKQDIRAKPDTILGNPSEIHQIMMNLCTNAAHAMREKGGVLEVRLANFLLDQGESTPLLNLSPGHYLELMVKDTGHGMDPSYLERIFDPYFTTKAPGEGTGLGLAVVKGIVTRLGGAICAESEIGRGTTFHVFLPVRVEAAPMVTSSEKPLPHGAERILLVDDDEIAVEAIQGMLDSFGYQVTTRTSSIEALALFRSKPDAFDLIITDMTMPNMTGAVLAREVMRIRPDTPIILCTGFSEQIDDNEAKKMGIRKFVMKPVAPSKIARTIRKVLDGV